MSIEILQGDSRELLPTFAAGSVQMICTSPPYWRMRQYTDDPREIGQEPTHIEYVAALADVFALCWRVLRDDGTLWLNLGDCYANDGKWGGATGGKHATGLHGHDGPGRRRVTTGLPPKSLMGMPWRVAFALQDQGWILRSEIIWHKPNAMPESVKDRPARDHETIFLFSKSARYYYNASAIAVSSVRPGDVQTFGGAKGRAYTPSPGDPNFRNGSEQWGRTVECADTRNARTVWSITSAPIPEEHYAPMPQALAERCILAGSRASDTVLDLFAGSGTTLRAAAKLQRNAIGVDLGYGDMQARRTDGVQLVSTELWQ